MKKSKANIICTLICIVITLALVGLAVFGIVKNNINNDENNQKIEDARNEEIKQNTDETDGNEESENTSGDLTDIPSIKEEPIRDDTAKAIKEKGHIMVLIQNREGLQIKKKNLSYPELKQLVEKLEGLC